MKIIFLDIDGVLNDHSMFSNNYCGIMKEKVDCLNFILETVPDVFLVISSAWRYQILCGDVTLKGFEMLLLSHGLNCFKRVIGHTCADELIAGREEQILDYISKTYISKWVVLDDLDLQIQNIVKCDSKVGLTMELAQKVINILESE